MAVWCKNGTPAEGTEMLDSLGWIIEKVQGYVVCSCRDAWKCKTIVWDADTRSWTSNGG